MDKENTVQALWNCYAAYMDQLGYEGSALLDLFNTYPHLEKMMWRHFQHRFDPSPETLQDATEPFPADTLDQNLVILHSLIQSTVRTNFFVPKRQAVALKFVHPDTMIEIFMDHPSCQGTFMKQKPVSRGGIRLSNRADFREECLQLVRTQGIKNVVVVPSGGKGVIKEKEGISEALSAYKIYIECILDLTDNVVDGKVIPPSSVRCYDKEDFYNVVGADKGTAFFADEANKISCARGYWLGDAFASGGEYGYHHKKLAITARGVWVSVRHHMARKGISFHRPLTVIAIGDMSGDVCGNGLLGERNLKLLAAFSHSYIFLDPNPDPELSYQERCRLFHLAQSTWADYKQFSEGGAVFCKKDTPFSLSPQCQMLLGWPEKKIDTDTLVQRILKMPVDLFWLGGVGTFVSARGEAQVHDALHKNMRIGGAEVKSSIVGEGANLGFTQQGRIEYALSGGRLNADFVDNSAGVNCSDREVNIKILLSQPLQRGQLSIQMRNKLLSEMADDVCSLTLKDNHWQNIAISFVENKGLSVLQPLIRCIHMLGDRIFMPQAEDLCARAGRGQSITRPEIAALIANTKLFIKDLLQKMTLETKGRQEVLDYFPLKIQEEFSEIISQHILYKELKCMILSNRLIHLCGPYFLNELASQAQCPLSEVIASALDFYDLMNGAKLVQKIESLFHTPTHIYPLLDLFQEMMSLVLRDVFDKKCTLQASVKNVSQALAPYQAQYTKALDYILI